MAGPECLLPVAVDRLLAIGANGDEGNPHAGELLDEVDVILGLARQVIEAAAAGDVLLPTGNLDVLGLSVIEDALVLGDGGVRDAIALVGGADLDGVEAAEDIELGDREVRQAVDAGRRS